MNTSMTRTAIAGLIALAAPCSPALAERNLTAPYVVADMMPGAPGPGAMPGPAMRDKMGGMAPPGMAGPPAGMVPGQPPAAGPPPGMGMQDDKMGAMPPAGAGMPQAGGASPAAGMPAAGMPAPGGMMPPAMMKMMSTMMDQMGKMPPQAAPLDHVEGRIAFMKAELAVTDAETPAWDQFALALRTARGHLTEANQALTASQNGQTGAPNRLEAYEHHLSMRLDSLRGARESFQRLYVTLDPAQKQTADELVAPLLESF